MSNSVSQVDRVSDMAPAWQLCVSVGRLQKRDTGLCLPFCLRDSCPPALALMPSVLPHMPLVPFKLLPQCWSSEGLSLSKFVCRSLRVTAWDSRSFFHQLNPCLFLHPEVVRTYLPGMEPCVGEPGVGLGLFITKISLPNVIP